MPVIISRQRAGREYRLIFDALDDPDRPRLYAAFTTTADGRVAEVRDLHALMRCWDEGEMRAEVREAARAKLAAVRELREPF